MRKVNEMGCCLASPTEPPVVGKTDSSRAEEVLDRSALLSQVGDDLDLLRYIAQLFLEDEGAFLSAISDSIARQDSRALELAAHKLKGSPASFHALRVIEAAESLEMIRAGGDLSRAADATAALEQEMRRLKPLLIKL